MWPPARLRPALRDDHRPSAVVTHDHGAHGRIWPRVAQPAPAELEGKGHEAGVAGVVHVSNRDAVLAKSSGAAALKRDSV
jgi:hypothetical protein